MVIERIEIQGFGPLPLQFDVLGGGRDNKTHKSFASQVLFYFLADHWVGEMPVPMDLNHKGKLQAFCVDGTILTSVFCRNEWKWVRDSPPGPQEHEITLYNDQGGAVWMVDSFSGKAGNGAVGSPDGLCRSTDKWICSNDSWRRWTHSRIEEDVRFFDAANKVFGELAGQDMKISGTARRSPWSIEESPLVVYAGRASERLAFAPSTIRRAAVIASSICSAHQEYLAKCSLVHFERPERVYLNLILDDATSDLSEGVRRHTPKGLVTQTLYTTLRTA